MDADRAIEVVKSLADGVDPFTGERFPASSPCQHADTEGGYGVGDMGSALDLGVYKDRWICDVVYMARHLRIEYQGAIYHVTCRMLGDAQSRLFKDDCDRERFLDRLAEMAGKKR